jgi:hypothetical protein
MKPVLERLRAVGASDTTVNIFLVVFFIFVFLIGASSAGVLFWEIITGRTLSPILIAIVTTMLGIISALGVATHSAVVINGTAAKTSSINAQNFVQPVLDSASKTVDSNALLMQQIIAAVSTMQLDQQKAAAETAKVLALNVASPTAAAGGPIVSEIIQQNTEATKENTDVMKEQEQAGKQGG